MFKTLLHGITLEINPVQREEKTNVPLVACLKGISTDI